MFRQNLNFKEAPKCAIGYSKFVDGEGLFLIHSVDKGEIVIDYRESSKNWKLIKFEDLPEWNKSHHWWIGVDTLSCILPSFDSVFMRANHYHLPNLSWIPSEKICVANRCLFPGMELCYDYTLEICSDVIKRDRPQWAITG